MKIRFLISFIFLISISFSSLCRVESPIPKPSSKRPMPELSEKELVEMEEMFSQLLEGLDPETIDSLAKIGEEIEKEAARQGKDPFDFILEEAEKEEPFMPIPPQPEVKPEKPTVPAKPLPPTEDLASAREMLENIARTISAIRIKAKSEKYLSDALAPFKYHLDDITYFVKVITHDKLIKYLFEDEFKPLYKNLQKLNRALTNFNAEFEVPEFKVEAENPYKLLGISPVATQEQIISVYQTKAAATNPDLVKEQLKKEEKPEKEIAQGVQTAQDKIQALTDAYRTIRTKKEAQYALSKILNVISESIHTDNIIDEFKALLKKYEPEKLKLFKEREEEEKKLRAQQERIARTQRPTIAPLIMPSYSPGRYYEPRKDYYDSDYKGPAVTLPKPTRPGVTPSRPGEKPKPARPSKPKKVEKDKKDKDKDKKDKDKVTKKPTKPIKPRLLEEVEDRTKAIERAIKDIKKQFIGRDRELLAGFGKFLATEYSQADDTTVNLFFSKFDTITKKFEEMNETITDALETFKTDRFKKQQFTEALHNVLKKAAEVKKEVRKPGQIPTPKEPNWLQLIEKGLLTIPKDKTVPGKQYLFFSDIENLTKLPQEIVEHLKLIMQRRPPEIDKTGKVILENGEPKVRNIIGELGTAVQQFKKLTKGLETGPKPQSRRR